MHASSVRRKPIARGEQEAFGDKFSMLRLGEPEPDPWWPDSSSPPDNKLPPLFHFPSEFRVSTMWNDGGAFPFPSSPLSTSFAGNSESRTRSSNASAELEGQYDGMNISTTPQNCDAFQLGSFTPPLSPGLSTTLNFDPGDGDILMVTAAINPKPPSMAQILPNNVAGCNKRMASSDPTSKRITNKRASKRLKTPENLHESAAIHPRLMKAPVRRSQKLGDKITALQQLVSPFGKTDTASVLHEATICIRYLHDQIQVLTTPCFGIKCPPHHLQGHGGGRGELRKRGLCLAPISSTIISLINQQANSSHSPERTRRATSARFY